MEKENMENTQNTQTFTQKKRKGAISLEQRRELRAEYRAIIAETEEQRPELLNGSIKGLVSQIRKGDKLFKKGLPTGYWLNVLRLVEKTQEGVLDSQFLLKAADIAAEKAKKIRLEASGFDIQEYTSKVTGKLRHLNYDWSELAEITKKSCLLIPEFGFMLGAITIDPKDKTVRRQTKRLVKDNAKLKKPETVTIEQAGQGNENETTNNVQLIHDILESHCDEGPISLYSFAFNPSSFSQTVENLFYISFLVRDGKVNVTEDEENENLLMIETCDPPTADQLQDPENGIVKHQNILHFDVQTWKKIVDDNELKDCIIPNREPVPDASAATWQ